MGQVLEFYLEQLFALLKDNNYNKQIAIGQLGMTWTN